MSKEPLKWNSENVEELYLQSIIKVVGILSPICLFINVFELSTNDSTHSVQTGNKMKFILFFKISFSEN